MADSNKDKRDLASGILGVIGGIGSLADLVYPGVGTGIRMAATGTNSIVAAALPDEAGTTPSNLTPAQLEGLLVQAEPAPQVYQIVNGTKRWISSEAIMRNRFRGELVGGRWNNVHYVSPAVVAQFPDGAPITEVSPPAPSSPAVAETRPTEPAQAARRSEAASDSESAQSATRGQKMSRARAFDAPTFGRSSDEDS